MTPTTQETMPGTIREQLDGLRAPLRNLRTQDDTRRARLDSVAVEMLGDDSAALRKEQAGLLADIAAFPAQVKHLAAVESAGVAQLLARESARVECELREVIAASQVLEKELRGVINTLHGCISLPEPAQSQRRAELSAQYDAGYPSFAQIQKQIQRLRAEESLILIERQTTAAMNRGGRSWVC